MNYSVHRQHEHKSTNISIVLFITFSGHVVYLNHKIDMRKYLLWKFVNLSIWSPNGLWDGIENCTKWVWEIFGE